MTQQYKIVIAYDGTGYVGWIQQPDQPSIVQTLQDAFARTFEKDIRLLGASKTDAGVHAMGQVAVFKTDLEVDPDKMKWAWNNALPASIMIRSLEQDDQFNPHENVEEKTYYYHIFLERPLPFYARYGAHIAYPIDMDQFKKALALFKGTHDFHAFYTGDDRDDTVRSIKNLYVEWIERYNCYRVVVIGEKFLRHMVRRIVGAALAVASRKSVGEKDIMHALKERKNNCELPTAPAQGLMLYKIKYNNRG